MNRKVLLTGACAISILSLLAAPGPTHGRVTDQLKNSLSLSLDVTGGEKSLSIGKGEHAFQLSRFGSADAGSGKSKSSILLGVDDLKGVGGKEKADFRYSMGIPFLSMGLFSWGKYNRNNEFIGFRGVSYGLGYYSKNYYEPPKKHSWNGFWHWGTVYLLIPYIGIGTEYTTNNVYFEVGTFYILPYLGLGVHFN